MNTMNKNLILILAIMTLACNEQPHEEQKSEPASGKAGTFAYDVQFLSKHDSNLVQLTADSSGILVSPKYQSKVFTSTATGVEGKSFGWINYKAFAAPVDPHMNAYGGENRFWLGPEGGKYSLYFKKGDSMVFDNWKTPKAFDIEPWQVAKKDARSVTMTKDMVMSNYTGAELSMNVERTITLMDKPQIEKELAVTLGDSVKFVGYSTQNILKNTGKEKWTEKTGMPNIWILDMFNPSPSTTIAIPYKPANGDEKVATTDYFGEIGKDRIKMDGKTLFFKADGHSRGKLGIVPKHVLPVSGSYDSENNILTLITFDVDSNARYLNQEWNTSKPVFSGDASNAYNDGPLADGSQMGPFYELESVSPAANLAPGDTLRHQHNVYHFTGNKEELNVIAAKALGVSLDTIAQTFK
jgi:hypothetical protein